MTTLLPTSNTAATQQQQQQPTEPLTLVQCPHCSDWIELESINCGIFRHGVFRHSLQQLPPHASQAECMAAQPLIYGCGKPFQWDPATRKAIPCEYI